jgi:hypothetical protein
MEPDSDEQYDKFDFDSLPEDLRKDRSRQVEQLHMFLLRTGREAMRFDLFAVGMIEEGGAVWEEESKTLKIDYRYADGPAYGIQFYEDGEIWIVDAEGNPKRSG